jgi:hypothetical protein
MERIPPNQQPQVQAASSLPAGKLSERLKELDTRVNAIHQQVQVQRDSIKQHQEQASRLESQAFDLGDKKQELAGSWRGWLS